MINIHSKHMTKLREAFVKDSYLVGRLDNTYSWSGVREIHVYDAVTVDIVDYRRTGQNRYGNPEEMQDIKQTLTVTQDKAFTFTLDLGYQDEQQYIKPAGKMLRKQIREKLTPWMDDYGFNKLVRFAGTIVGRADIDQSTILDAISDGTVHLDDAEYPDTDRTLYVPSYVYKILKHSDEFIKTESLAKTSLVKGQVGTYDNMPVVKVTKRRWPTGLIFLILHKGSAAMPVKLNEMHIHNNPPGIRGALVEGSTLFDLFVYGRRADGVYAAINTASSGSLFNSIGSASIAQAPAIDPDTGAITGESDSVFWYTTDGSDPRYFDGRATGATVANPAAGMIVKAYAEVNGKLPSAVTTVELTL